GGRGGVPAHIEWSIVRSIPFHGRDVRATATSQAPALFHATIRHFLSRGSRVSLASMADSVTLNHAARIIATVAPDVPADAALRRYLYKAKRLGGPQKRA